MENIESVAGFVKAKVDEMLSFLYSVRCDIHRYPELGFGEVRTSAKIKEILERAGIPTQSVAGTGVIGLIRGGLSGKTIALRADMDALPMEEKTNVPYRSTIPGVAHSCGHDGHVAILIGAALTLAALKDRLPGNAKLIFQPAEEVTAAPQLIEEGVLTSEPAVSAIYGVHLWPTLDSGKIGVEYGYSMAAVDSIHLKIRGRGGHGAAPHEATDALLIATQIVNMLQVIKSNLIDPVEPSVITIGVIKGGYRRNIIADEVEIAGSVRTFDPHVREAIERKVKRIADGVTYALGGEYELQYTPSVCATMNNGKTTAVVEEASRRLLGPENVIRIQKPSLTGEDFGFYAQIVPGAYIKIGSRNETKGYTHPLHSPFFDFDELPIATGAKVLAFSAYAFLCEAARPGDDEQTLAVAGRREGRYELF